MSVLVLIRKQIPEVALVRYYRNPFYPNSYVEIAAGPPIKFSANKFRLSGFEWLKKHLAEYEKVRLSEETAAPVFAPGEAKKFLKAEMQSLSPLIRQGT